MGKRREAPQETIERRLAELRSERTRIAHEGRTADVGRAAALAEQLSRRVVDYNDRFERTRAELKAQAERAHKTFAKEHEQIIEQGRELDEIDLMAPEDPELEAFGETAQDVLGDALGGPEKYEAIVESFDSSMWGADPDTAKWSAFLGELVDYLGAQKAEHWIAETLAAAADDEAAE